MSNQLIHRLSRIQGQLEAIKKILETEGNKDCLRTIRLVKAANNALKKFGEAYINTHMDECLTNNPNPKNVEKDVREIITSVFTL